MRKKTYDGNSFKQVYIDVHGPIFELEGMIYGPATARLKCAKIERMISRGRKIYEILPSGEKIRLDRTNIYKDNSIKEEPTIPLVQNIKIKEPVEVPIINNKDHKDTAFVVENVTAPINDEIKVTIMEDPIAKAIDEMKEIPTKQEEIEEVKEDKPEEKRPSYKKGKKKYGDFN